MPQIKIFSGKRPRLLHCKKRHFQRELVSATVRFLCLVSANTVGTLCKYVSVFMFSEATGLARGSCRPRGFFSSSELRWWESLAVWTSGGVVNIDSNDPTRDSVSLFWH